MVSRALRGRLVLALAVLLLAACRAAPTLTPVPPTRPAPTALPQPSATSAPTATSAAEPATATPTPDALAGWVAVETEAFSMRLPEGWRIVDLTTEDATAMLDQMRAEQPRLADIIGGADALENAALFAVGPERAGLVDTLTVRRSPLGAERITDLKRQVVDVVAAQHEKLGFSPQAGLTDARTDEGLPLASVRYEIRGDGVPPLQGEQFFVATDADLWILTYSAFPPPGRLDPTTFERSARTFAPR